MQKSKVLVMVFVALIMAVGASWVANKAMIEQVSTGKTTEVAVQQVTVAAKDIKYGQKLAEEDLALKEIPTNLFRNNMYKDMSELLGKVSKDDIFTGDIIIQQRIAEKAEGAILASLVSPEMRAVSVRVNDVIGVAGFLLPGNRVDVLASRMVKQRSLIRTLLENIKVLAVDQTVSPDKDKPVIVRAVTLEVSPDNSEMLFKAIQEGSIHLTLRNPLDKKSTIDEGASVENIDESTSESEKVAKDLNSGQIDKSKAGAQNSNKKEIKAKKVVKKKLHRKKFVKRHKVVKKGTSRIDPSIVEAADLYKERKPATAVTIIRGTTMREEVFN